MRDPLWRVKSLPWITLIQDALLTVLVATVLDVVLIAFLTVLFSMWPAGSGLTQQILWGGGIAALLVSVVAAGGLGVLAVVLMERVFRSVRLDGATLWGLVGCLALVLWLKSLLPIPSFLVGISYIQFVGMMLGLFSQGRSHWRW
jgi:hypothetical protein